jgi:LacI family transcriptional regulator
MRTAVVSPQRAAPVSGGNVATRNDVARAAGVSTAVVSYVLNNGPRPVAAATRAKVLQAIEELGYRPNGVARSLRTNRTRVVALIIPDMANSFFAQLSREVELAAFSRDFTLVVGNTMDDTERGLLYAQSFMERRVDGVIFVSSGADVEIIDLLTAADVPVVSIDRDVPAKNVSSVRVDNRHGGYLATRHLIDHGHRRIACLAGPPTVGNAVDRRKGWESALREAGLRAPARLAATSPSFSRDAAYRSTLRLLGYRQPPTAVFATADEQALGVYRAAAATGRRIPDDLAVVSFDSAETAPYLVPGLTSVRQPIDQIARHAIDRLQDRLAQPPRPTTRDTLPIDLVLRGSCGCDDSEPDV